MTRLAMTRVDEGAKDVPVAISVKGAFKDSILDDTSSGLGRLKNMAGTEPHVSGPMKVATAD